MIKSNIMKLLLFLVLAAFSVASPAKSNKADAAAAAANVNVAANNGEKVLISPLRRLYRARKASDTGLASRESQPPT